MAACRFASRFPYLFWLHRCSQPRPSALGFSLLEVIVSILVFGIVLGFMAPLVFVVQATRVQNRRFEQALALAQRELDRMQAEVIRGVEAGDNEEGNPLAAGRVPPETAAELAAAPAPTAVVASYGEISAPTHGLAVDVDGVGDGDYLVQTFRDAGLTFGEDGAAAQEFALFRMGVRVYAGEAADNFGAGLGTERAPVTLTTGLGQHATQPLAVLYGEVARSDREASLDSYRDYLADEDP